MKYYNIVFYISGLLFFTSTVVGAAENLPTTDNPYAPPQPLENSNKQAGDNSQAVWEDKHRTPDNPWLAAHQAMLNTPVYAPQQAETWSNMPVPTAPAPYPNQAYNTNAYPPASYPEVMPNSGYAYPQAQAYNHYAPTPNNNYAYAPAQQPQYAPQSYPQYPQQYAQQYTQQPAYQSGVMPQQPNYNYNAPNYANAVQAPMNYPSQTAAGFAPNYAYNAPANNNSAPNYNYQGNVYAPAAQWSNAPAQTDMGQHAYVVDAAGQRLIQRLDRPNQAMPHYATQYPTQGQVAPNTSYAQQAYQMMPNNLPNNTHAYAPAPASANAANPAMPTIPAQMYGQMPANPLTQRPHNPPVPPMANDLMPPHPVMPPVNPQQQEVIVIQRPQPGTGEYKLKEVLGPAPGDPMIFHAREPDAERPKPGTGEYKVKELLGPAPGDPRAYQDLTQEVDIAKTPETPPASELEAVSAGHVLEPPAPASEAAAVAPEVQDNQPAVVESAPVPTTPVDANVAPPAPPVVEKTAENPPPSAETPVPSEVIPASVADEAGNKQSGDEKP